MPSAYFLASRAFSPAGTRKTSTPARRTPSVFCFTPPIGSTEPSSASSPVAATLRPWVTLRPSSWRMSSANASPAEGPPIPCASI
jgi:hypothetical protein